MWGNQWQTHFDMKNEIPIRINNFLSFFGMPVRYKSARE
ncbi:MAG: hypothetical protein K0S74_1751 [Chlamydiales bacterium]|jgi:hypothetical protein|nr:hypothetical protein [Chlamydiales bacterium]